MRIFLITFVVSTVSSLALWQLGLASKISPAHPFFTTVIVAAGCGIAVQLILSRDSATHT
jgi:hypothetical protein